MILIPSKERLITKRRVAFLALAVLVVVDVALVVLALRPSTPPAPVQALSLAEGVSTPTESAPAPTESPESFDPPAPMRLVVARSDGSALAVVTGACDGTKSTGARFPSQGGQQTVELPGGVVGRLDLGENDQIELVAASQDCTGEVLFSEGAEVNQWEPLGDPADTSFMFAGGAGVNLPTGQVPYPCAVVSFDTRGTQTSVLCEDGSTRTTQGSGWQPGGTLTNGLSLAYVAGSNDLVGLATAPDCEGLTVNRASADGNAWTRISCVSQATAQGSVTGLGAQGATIVLVDADGSAYRSFDGGVQFTPIGG